MSIQTFGINDLVKIVDRAAAIVGTYGHSRTTPERVDAMTRAGLTVEHVYQELEAFTRFVYMQAPNGRLLHVQPNGQFAYGICTPWRGVSTLTSTERSILRKWLLLKADHRLRPPFLYSPDTRRWHLDLKRYPTVDSALEWLDRHKLTAGEWLNLIP